MNHRDFERKWHFQVSLGSIYIRVTFPTPLGAPRALVEHPSRVLQERGRRRPESAPAACVRFWRARRHRLKRMSCESGTGRRSSRRRARGLQAFCTVVGVGLGASASRDPCGRRVLVRCAARAARRRVPSATQSSSPRARQASVLCARPVRPLRAGRGVRFGALSRSALRNSVIELWKTTR